VARNSGPQMLRTEWGALVGIRMLY
jgi:hypothetical protein